MQDFVREASRYLPATSPEGTIIKIPINENTGRFIEEVRQDNEARTVYYCFLRSTDEWVFLGRGLTA
jgi:hypothetical protein